MRRQMASLLGSGMVSVIPQKTHAQRHAQDGFFVRVTTSSFGRTHAGVARMIRGGAPRTRSSSDLV